MWHLYRCSMVWLFCELETMMLQKRLNQSWWIMVISRVQSFQGPKNHELDSGVHRSHVTNMVIVGSIRCCVVSARGRMNSLDSHWKNTWQTIKYCTWLTSTPQLLLPHFQPALHLMQRNKPAMYNNHIALHPVSQGATWMQKSHFQLLVHQNTEHWSI